MKNYYKILNVEFDATEETIRSTYKALSKIYHPDLYKGDKKHAEAKMKEINEAYACLKDPIKRQKHDDELKGNDFNFQDSDKTYSDHFDEDLNEYGSRIKDDWDFATQYHPEIITEFNKLQRVDKKVAFNFRVYVIENKAFSNGKLIANMF